jgi:hypothetical protein
MEGTYSIVQLGLYTGVPFLLAVGLFFFARDAKTQKAKVTIIVVAFLVLLAGVLLGLGPFNAIQSSVFIRFHEIGERRRLAYYAPLVGNAIYMVALLIGSYFLLRKPKKGQRRL